MNKVLIKRIFKKQSISILIYGLSLFLFHLLMVSLYPTMGDSMIGMLDNMPPIFQNMFGGELISFTNLNSFVSIGYNHPIVVFLLVFYPLTTAIAAVAAEVKTGTAELLFTRPLRRYKVILSNFLVLLAAGLIIIIAGALGSYAGLFFIDIKESIDIFYLLRLVINSLSLIIAVAGFSFFLSLAFKKIENSGKNAAYLFAFMYVMDFLVDIWEAIKPLRFLSIFYYYTPEKILQGDNVWIINSFVLAITGLIFTVLAIFILERRDL